MQHKTGRKNKTTKKFFVVELHCIERISTRGVMVSIGYFFFAAFLAFLAGAFFAGMVVITPFRSKHYAYETLTNFLIIMMTRITALGDRD
jgi:hypothetical protein